MYRFDQQSSAPRAVLKIAIIAILLLSSFIDAISANANVLVIKDPITVTKADPMYEKKPYVDGVKTFYGGDIQPYEGKSKDVTSPIVDEATGERAVIGKLAQMTTDDVKKVLGAAKAAWSGGRGVWPQMSLGQRINAMEKVVEGLRERRQEIVDVLMWEICKSADDAAIEFDRTMKFVEATITALRDMDRQDGIWRHISGVFAKIRRAAIGIMLCLGPFNYPFNETYATLVPALLAGNVVIMKIPNTGGLAHVLTMEVYARHLPPGAINFFSGAGAETMGPLMSTGDIDILAFIGGSWAADQVIKAHPHPHRLKTFLQLEGKNLGIVLPDADIDIAVKQITLGSTNYNGQRCTAIKLVMLHRSIAEQFMQKFQQSINGLKWGLPWTKGGVDITPLPEPKKPKYLEELIADAISKGASIMNAREGGGEAHGALIRPAIIYPVNEQMRVWQEEQFGPVIPVAVYDDIEEVYAYLATSPYGQQAAVFSGSSAASAPVLDVLSTVVGRININTQCSRSPDVLPFSGRRSSALGTMSVTEAIKEFSIEVVVATKHDSRNEQLVRGFDQDSVFLQSLPEPPAAQEAPHSSGAHPDDDLETRMAKKAEKRAREKAEKSERKRLKEKYAQSHLEL